MTVSVLPLGDAAFTLVVDGLTEAEGAQRINALTSALWAQRAQGDLAGMVDLIPASRSLTVCFDPAMVAFETLSRVIAARAQVREETGESTGETAARAWRLPACYDAAFGLDGADVAAATGLDGDAIMAAHSAQTYTVLLIGFLPGFPFLGPLDARLRLPRRAEPRARVPAGSIAIAGDRTAIYPWNSPGGWWVLAHCPVPLFDPGWPQPSLLQPGDVVRFAPVSAADIAALEAALKAGELTPACFRITDAPA